MLTVQVTLHTKLLFVGQSRHPLTSLNVITCSPSYRRINKDILLCREIFAISLQTTWGVSYNKWQYSSDFSVLPTAASVCFAWSFLKLRLIVLFLHMFHIVSVPNEHIKVHRIPSTLSRVFFQNLNCAFALSLTFCLSPTQNKPYVPQAKPVIMWAGWKLKFIWCHCASPNNLFINDFMSFYVYGSVHHNIFYEITNRCSYMHSILFHC